MNEEIVTRIKSLAKAAGTSCTKIEAEYGWGNGTIGKWAKMKSLPPLERLQAVAQRLGVSVDFLLTGEDEKKPAPISENELTPYILDVVRVMEKVDANKQKQLREIIINAYKLMGE